MSEINWKSKYQELKLKFMNAVDTAFRLGFEQGQQQAQQQAAMEQAQQAQQMMAAQQAAAQGGMPGEEGGAPGEEQPPQEGEGQPGMDAQGGSELDQHINTLEGMLGKSELDQSLVGELKKSLDFLKLQKQERDNKIAQNAIKGIAKALKKPIQVKPRVMAEAASHNLNPAAKSALSMQEKIVSDIMKSWETEEKKAGSDILSVLANEGLVKKD